MKFKVQIKTLDQLSITQEDSAETYKLKKPMQLQISDQNDFKKQVYLLVSELLHVAAGQDNGNGAGSQVATQLRQLAQYRDSYGLLSSVCLQVATDSFKTMRNRCLKQESAAGQQSDTERHLMLATEMLSLFKAVWKVEHDLFRGTQVLSTQLLEWISKTHLEMQAVEQMVGQVSSLLTELALEEMEEVLNGLLDDLGILLVTLSKEPELKQIVEIQLTAQFELISQTRPKLLLYRSLVRVSKATKCLPFDKFIRSLFCAKVASSAVQELPTLLETMLYEANYVGIMEQLNQFRFIAKEQHALDKQDQAVANFSQIFKRAYLRNLRKTKTADISEIHNVLAQFDKIRTTVQEQSQGDQGAATASSCLLSAPGFLELVIQSNREYLLQVNISDEIASYFDIEIGKGEEVIDKLGNVLMYNLDKERLEEALRRKLILRLLDQQPKFNIQREKAFSEALRGYYGGKFNHRLQLLLESRSDEPQSTSNKLSVTTIPATVWPSSFPNPLSSAVIEPQLLRLSQDYRVAYKMKFEKRKIDMMPWFGTVDLILDRRHQVRVNTGQATCLLIIEARGKLSVSDLSECMAGIDQTILRKLIAPLLDSTVLTEELSCLKIESASQVEASKLGKALLSSANYTDIMAKSTVQVTLDRQLASGNADAVASGSGALLQYSHPKHKHRLMAFVTKTVKRVPTQVASMVELAIQNFASKGITLVEENVLKGLDELKLKELVNVEAELITYVP